MALNFLSFKLANLSSFDCYRSTVFCNWKGNRGRINRKQPNSQQMKIGGGMKKMHHRGIAGATEISQIICTHHIHLNVYIYLVEHWRHAPHARVVRGAALPSWMVIFRAPAFNCLRCVCVCAVFHRGKRWSIHEW